jgi:hypothetical protein
MAPFPERLGASSLDGGEAVAQHSRQDLDHLPVAIPRGGELAADPGQVRRTTAAIKREMKRRAAIEPVIGHLKASGDASLGFPRSVQHLDW